MSDFKRLSSKLRSHTNGTHIQFWCPACDRTHVIRLTGYQPWIWNGDVEKPTFIGSVLHMGMQTVADEHGRWTGEFVYKNNEPVLVSCHSHVSNGKIEYLSDCTHEYAGKTLDLPDWNTHETDGLPSRAKKTI